MGANGVMVAVAKVMLPLANGSLGRAPSPRPIVCGVNPVEMGRIVP